MGVEQWAGINANRATGFQTKLPAHSCEVIREEGKHGYWESCLWVSSSFWSRDSWGPSYDSVLCNYVVNLLNVGNLSGQRKESPFLFSEVDNWPFNADASLSLKNISR